MSETRENAPVAAPLAGGGDGQVTLRVHRPTADRVVVDVGGEVDMLSSPRLRDVLLGLFSDGCGVRLLVLALDGVVFLGTSGLAVLIEVRDTAQAAGVALRLACTARQVLRPLAIAGLVSLFDIHPTADEALATPIPQSSVT